MGKNPDSGSGINITIPDQQHYFLEILKVLCFLSLIESLHIMTSGGVKNMKRVRHKGYLFPFNHVSSPYLLGRGRKK